MALNVTSTGIDFTPQGGSSVNLLDDYEEGTFTGTLRGDAAAPSTPVTSTGKYTKIGRKVYIQITYNTVDTTGASGNFQITGLPFTADGAYGFGTFHTHGFTRDTSKWVFPNISGGTTIAAMESSSGGAWTDWQITAGSGKYLICDLHYIV